MSFQEIINVIAIFKKVYSFHVTIFYTSHRSVLSFLFDSRKQIILFIIKNFFSTKNMFSKEKNFFFKAIKKYPLAF